MISKAEFKEAQDAAADAIVKAGIAVSDDEITGIDVADFGLGHLKIEGAQILTFFNTERVAAKVIYLYPGQTEPEHWHPRVGNDLGKEETLRCIKGRVRVGVDGKSDIPDSVLPEGKADFYTCRKEIMLEPGMQVTFQPLEKHWFQAVDDEAVLFTFSSSVRDALDGFTDPEIKRFTKVSKE